MIGCFCLHLAFYIIVGITFLKDFNLFNDDITLLMHAGNLSNISLEIRRYEKNFIIRHNNADFNKVIEYVDEAQQFVPQVIDDLQIMPQPTHLDDLRAKLTAYEETFKEFKRKCTFEQDTVAYSLQEKVRILGQDLVNITENLVLFEQNKMTAFIEKFTIRLGKTIIFLVLLSVFTITLLYTSIVKPLRKVENAAIDIANGTFSLLPVDDKKGEVCSVLRVFNKMVIELKDKQEQLFQAKKLSSIGTLASGTAHQINNPLNNISTSCQLALADLDGDKNLFVVKMLQTINQETERAGKIVRGLLEFSRVQTFSPQAFQLAKIVSKVIQLVASEVPAGITIDTKIAENIIVYIDVQKMIEALLNLTINAIQAISEPSGNVSIEAEKDAEQKNVAITIADTGTGIDQEHLSKIFDPFFTTKNARNGTGLGLAVVYGIIKKQNGSIRVESTKGKGTSFIITLPLHSEPAESELLNKHTTSREING